MAGIFGIIGDISRSGEFTRELMHLDGYKSTTLTVDDRTLFGITALEFMDDKILERDNLVISLNGEYYTDETDATASREKVFELFKKQGRKFVSELDGIFNIFLYDKTEKRLLLMNDWAGNHNLFYHFNGRTFIFSTEIKGILKIIAKKTGNKKGFAEQLMFGHMLFDETPVEEIQLLDPGTILEFHNNTVRTERYFCIEESYRIENNKSKSAYKEELYPLLERPVLKYLNREDISLPLTGGLDSRFLLHFLLKHRYPLKDVYTVGTFENEDVRIAKDICRKYRLPYRAVSLSTEYLIQNFFENYRISEGFIPHQLYFPGLQEVKEAGCNHIISFPSADLTFGGRYAHNTRKYVGEFPIDQFIKTSIFSKLLKCPESMLRTLFNERSGLFDQVKTGLLAYFDSLREFPSIFVYDHFSWYQHARRWGNVGGMFGQYIGRITPSNDRQVVAFAFNLPVRLKYAQHIYKETFKQFCPELLAFPREGIGIPVTWSEPVQTLFKLYRKHVKGPETVHTQKLTEELYRNHMREEIEKILFSTSLRDRNIFNDATVREIWNDHLQGTDRSYLIHNILTVELFFRNYID